MSAFFVDVILFEVLSHLLTHLLTCPLTPFGMCLPSQTCIKLYTQPSVWWFVDVPFSAIHVVSLCLCAGALYEQFDKFWIAKEPENVMAFNAVREDYKQALQESLRTAYTCHLPAEQIIRK